VHIIFKKLFNYLMFRVNTSLTMYVEPSTPGGLEIRDE
jgi:hypothetical protein